MDSDKSSRSVFVGNIPYEATEERLKEVFSEVGVVNSFKLVYDRENGKPKGYGFCEFKDAETALSAMRNLNGYEIGGRTLRVDSAVTEKNKMEMMDRDRPVGGGQGPMGGPGMPPGPMGMPTMGPSDGPYGPPVDPEKAPESISKAVASLPTEQRFELMKQMKACNQNNPQEARMMLNQNPQLAYALLQAQVVMRIVEPELAVTMLHKTPPKPPTFPMQQPGGGGGSGGHMAPMISGPPAPFAGGPMMQPPPMRPGMAEGPPAQMPFGSGPGGFGQPPPMAQEARRDPREDRFGGGGGGSRDPRNRDPRAGGGMGRGGPPPQGPSGMRPGLAGPSAPPQGLPPHLAGADPDKAQLIMQVLKLSDAQIAGLPADQRASIMELKKQINAVPL